MKISVIGAAGTLGSCETFHIFNHMLADEIVMIDSAEEKLLAQWADLDTAATGTDVLVRRGDYPDLAGSDIVINTAGTPEAGKSRPELLDENLSIIKNHMEHINRHCPQAIVITQTNPVDPLNYAAYLLSKNRDRRRIIGYTFNDSIRFRMWAAACLGARRSEVDGIVIGEHGASQVMCYSTLKVGGRPVAVTDKLKQSILDQQARMRDDARITKNYRTAGWTSAVGTVALLRAIKENTGQVLPCCAVLDGEYGCRDLCMTVPAAISKDGIADIRTLELAPDERQGLAKTIGVLEEYSRYVEGYLGIR